MKVSLKRKMVIGIKTNISKIVLFFLYRGFKILYKNDSRIKNEFDKYENGFTIKLQLAENAPCLILQKTENGIEKQKQIENSDIEICFKSIDAAFLVLTGRLSVANAYAEHRFKLKGDIRESMGFVRCVDLVESYLFPKFITKNLLKEIPKKEKSMITIYRKILINI